MLRKKSQGAIDGFGGFLAEGTQIDGEVRFGDELRIDGMVTGRIVSEKGRLLVGETGQIEAEVRVGSASISGTVAGTLVASVRVELHASGRFYGDLHAPALIVEEGAVLEGQCDMARGEAARPAVSYVEPAPAEAESEAAVDAPPTESAVEARPARSRVERTAAR